MAARRLILCLVSPYYFPYAPQISGVIIRLHRDRVSESAKVLSMNLGETAALTIRANCNQLCTPGSAEESLALVTNAIARVFCGYPNEDFYRYRFSIAQGRLEFPLAERDACCFVHLR
jgi:hypothetical protein